MRLLRGRDVYQTLMSSIRSNDRRGLVTNLVRCSCIQWTLDRPTRYGAGEDEVQVHVRSIGAGTASVSPTRRPRLRAE